MLLKTASQSADQEKQINAKLESLSSPFRAFIGKKGVGGLFFYIQDCTVWQGHLYIFELDDRSDWDVPPISNGRVYKIGVTQRSVQIRQAEHSRTRATIFKDDSFISIVASKLYAVEGYVQSKLQSLGRRSYLRNNDGSPTKETFWLLETEVQPLLQALRADNDNPDLDFFNDSTPDIQGLVSMQEKLDLSSSGSIPATTKHQNLGEVVVEETKK